MADVKIEGLSSCGNWVYFWLGDFAGDAKIVDGKVIDVQVLDASYFELTRTAELHIAMILNNWLEDESARTN